MRPSSEHPAAQDRAFDVREYLTWLLLTGTKRVTVHHVADLSRKRVADVMFLLDCGRVPVDRETRSVAIRDLLDGLYA